MALTVTSAALDGPIDVAVRRDSDDWTWFVRTGPGSAVESNGCRTAPSTMGSSGTRAS